MNQLLLWKKKGTELYNSKTKLSIIFSFAYNNIKIFHISSKIFTNIVAGVCLSYRNLAKLCGAPGFWENVLDSFFLFILWPIQTLLFVLRFLARHITSTKRARPRKSCYHSWRKHVYQLKQECIPVGCVLPAHWPLTPPHYAPLCHACPPATHVPLPCTPPLPPLPWTEWLTDRRKNIIFANFVCGR